MSVWPRFGFSAIAGHKIQIKIKGRPNRMELQSEPTGSIALNIISSNLNIDPVTKKLAAEFERDIRTSGEIEVAFPQLEILQRCGSDSRRMSLRGEQSRKNRNCRRPAADRNKPRHIPGHQGSLLKQQVSAAEQDSGKHQNFPSDPQDSNQPDPDRNRNLRRDKASDHPLHPNIPALHSLRRDLQKGASGLHARGRHA